MAKKKTTFVCQSCGNQSAKWLGKCPQCSEWNSFIEEIINQESSGSFSTSRGKVNKPKSLKDVQPLTQKRLIFEDVELNRVLGGGAIPGSLILLGGEPGIGKSTLMLQVALKNSQYKVLYVSGEESDEQIKTRADRILTETNENIYILTETDTQIILKSAENVSPDFIVIDSIQTLHSDKLDSAPGTVSQIRECTFEILAFAKSNSIPVFIVGHINKEGSLAGPKVLEHMVDTVLQFEGDRNHVYRILRVNKNRFGSTNEIGVYEMNVKGLKEITNPSEILISKKNQELSGNAISATIEGMRPFMIEVQALVSTAVYGTPQRSSTGYNSKRLNMLLAVLEKRVGFRLASKDVFLNITGGISVDDTALDLAVVAAVISSNEDIVLNEKYCFAAEVGLSGEIRPVQRLEQRITEAEKLGFSKIFISKFSKLNISPKSIKIIYLSKIEDLINNLN